MKDEIEAIWQEIERLNSLINQVAQVEVPITGDYQTFRDSKAQNTAGGTFTAGDWRKRTFTGDQDRANAISISSSVFTFDLGGIYFCRIRCPAYMVDAHKTRLRDTTNSSTLLFGSSAFASSVDPAQTDSWIIGEFTVDAGTTVEVQHQCQTTRATDGFGLPSNFEQERYSMAEFWRVE